MAFNVKKFALASALTMAVLYAICAAFVAIAPKVAIKFGGWMIHLTNVDQFAEVGMTLGGVLLGFLPILAYSFLGAYLFASLYNRFTKV